MHSIIICKLSNQSGVFFNLNFNIFCEYVTFNNLVNGDKTSNSAYLENELNLESPIIKFPEKIKQRKYLATDISEHNQIIPKLDFSTVLGNYKPLKKINVIEGAKATNRSSDEFIDKLQFQLKYAKNTIVNYSQKNKELKKLVVMLKQK